MTPDLEPVNSEEPGFHGSTRYITGNWDTVKDAISYWEGLKDHHLYNHQQNNIPSRVDVIVYEHAIVESQLLLETEMTNRCSYCQKPYLEKDLHGDLCVAGLCIEGCGNAPNAPKGCIMKFCTECHKMTYKEGPKND